MMNRKRAWRWTADHWKNRRKKLRLECRECEVICERVVSPWHCLKDSCPFVYVFQDGDTSYFGCLHKVFAPELDLSAFSDRSARAANDASAEIRRSGGRSTDPYGYLRVARSPRPECRVIIEQAYAPVSGRVSCCNPTFFHHPAGPAEEGIRLITNTLPDLEADHSDN
ncbi:MAG: hypothetical protein M1274_11550 [Actinobacteria bacterium]|nr:hypothetical protein [Actinomycetota bacterium]